jgi:hypothetical protein
MPEHRSSVSSDDMATATRPHPSPATIDPRVSHPLDHLRGVIRRYVLLEGLLSGLLFVACWFALGLVIDFGLFRTAVWDWVLDAPRAVRVLALVGSVLLFLGTVTLRMVRRLRKELSYPALALVLERRFPQLLGDRLITAVELADVGRAAKDGYSAEMIRQTIAEARARVADVPVRQVFNWRRLWVLGFLTAGLTFAIVLTGYVLYVSITGSFSLNRYAWRFAHVSGTFLERDVLLKNTPWPRRAHLELVGFPEEGPLRVGRDAAAPTVRVRYFQYLVPDASEHVGWRPARWSDLEPEWGRGEWPPFATFVSVEGIPAENTNNWRVDDVDLRSRAIAGKAEGVLNQLKQLDERAPALDAEVPRKAAELKRAAAALRSAAEERNAVAANSPQAGSPPPGPTQPTPEERRAQALVLEAIADVVEPNAEAMAFTSQLLIRKSANPDEQWQIKDAGSGTWRPMKWGDVRTVLGIATLPEVPSSRVMLSGAINDQPAPDTPVAEWTVWQVDLHVRILLSAMVPIRESLDRLAEVADRPSMGRRLRRLDQPPRVVLEYTGKTKVGDATLTPEQNNQFAGPITDLKEDVRFSVRAEDYRTDMREIHLVNAPMLEKLIRTDYQPAYLHHAPPAGEEELAYQPKPPDRLLPPAGLRQTWATQTQLVTADWQARRHELQGLRQRMRDIPLSPTGDQTTFSVPDGTEVVLTGVADSDLRAAYLEPRNGFVPGAIPGSRNWVPLSVGPDGRTVTIALRGDYRIGPGREFLHAYRDESGQPATKVVSSTPTVEFDLILEEKYGVQARRHFQIEAIPDEAPTVKVSLSGVRSVNAIRARVNDKTMPVTLPVPCYLVTPVARLEFTPESVVQDDRGLSDVSYRVERWVQDYVADGDKARPRDDKPEFDAKLRVPVNRFEELRRAVGRPRTELEALLLKPLRDEDRAPQVTTLEFRNADTDFFDLKDRVPLITSKDGKDRHYRIDLFVEAVDTNSFSGPGKTRNREPINLLVVSEPELLAAMNEDEAELAQQMSGVVKLVARARTNFEFVKLQNGTAPPAAIGITKLKAADVGQDVARARLAVRDVLADCKRLYRECRINRVSERTTERYGRLANRVDRVLGGDPPPVSREEADEQAHERQEVQARRWDPRGTFTATEPRLTAVTDAMKPEENGQPGQWADQARVDAAGEELIRLERELMGIRQEFGSELDLVELRKSLKALRDERLRRSKQLELLQKESEDDLVKGPPRIVPIGQVLIAKGQTKKVRQDILWREFNGKELVITFESSDPNGLIVPKSIIVPFNDDTLEIEYELKAGDQAGDYSVTVKPAVGKPVVVKVKVQ